MSGGIILEYILSIDAGTTSFKGAIFDRNGVLIASAGVSYNLITRAGSVVEFKAEGYLEALKETISILIKKSQINKNEIVGLAIDSQGETLILLDVDGHPLYNAIVWLDGRAVNEASDISAKFGVEKIYSITGQPEIAPTWPACKLLWVKRNKPRIFNKIHKIMLLEDYLIYILTGKFVAEKSLLTSTIYYDINTGDWWSEMLDYIGISRNQLPEIYDSAKPVANVSYKAAKSLGLSQHTIVVSGALDQLSGMIGSGAISGKKVCETTGTCMAVCVNTSAIPGYNSKYQIPCHAGLDGGHFYQIYWSQTAGAVLEWFKTNFYSDINATSSILKEMDKQAAQIPICSDGLTVIPHLSGKACPEFNSDARGVFYGVSLMHKREHFSRAIMESIAYMLREHIETAVSTGRSFDEIHSLGGGANSPLWNQIKADVTGKIIITMQNEEATCLGTAILAGVGTGLFSSVEQAVEKFVKPGKIYHPNMENKCLYDEGYNKYNEIYDLLKKSFSK